MLSSNLNTPYPPPDLLHPMAEKIQILSNNTSNQAATAGKTEAPPAPASAAPTTAPTQPAAAPAQPAATQTPTQTAPEQPAAPK